MPDQNDIDSSLITVAIRFPKEISSTHGLTEMMLALDSIELITTFWRQNDIHFADDFFVDFERLPFPWPLLGHPRRYTEMYKRLGTIRLNSLSINSPADFHLVANMAWLAILIVVLVTGTALEKYKTWRENAVLISQDALLLARSIKGLTKKQRDRLEQNITAFVSWIASSGEHVSLQAAAYFRQLQPRLISSEAEPPEITILPATDRSQEDPKPEDLTK
jgi:hypothetical protein